MDVSWACRGRDVDVTWMCRGCVVDACLLATQKIRRESLDGADDGALALRHKQQRRAAPLGESGRCLCANDGALQRAVAGRRKRAGQEGRDGRVRVSKP